MEHERQIRFPEQGREIVRTRLSPELALGNPDLYKARLIYLLPQETVHAQAAWEALYRLRRLHIDRLHIDPDSWISKNNAGQITLGAQPLPADWRARTMFEEHRFTGEREKVYILSHENSHELLRAIATLPDLNSLFANLIQMRARYNRGTSGMGSDSFYLNRERTHDVQQPGRLRATEDLTELINAYLLDPVYLRRTLDFLGDPRYSQQRETLGLTTLDSAVAREYIFTVVQRAVEAVIGAT